MRLAMMIDLSRCIGCGACVMGCKAENGTASGIYWCDVKMEESGSYPKCKVRYMPVACNHCMDAPCVDVCPTGASYKAKDGRTLINTAECIGCNECTSACPYGVRFFNTVDQSKVSSWEGFPPNPYELQKASERDSLNVSEKCSFCADRLMVERIPACVETCIAKARFFGDVDDPDSEISKAIKAKGAKPNKPELGTRPGFYYAGEVID